MKTLERKVRNGSLRNIIFRRYSVLIVALLCTLLLVVTAFAINSQLKKECQVHQREQVITANSIDHLINSSASAAVLVSTDARLQSLLENSCPDTASALINTLSELSRIIVNVSVANNDILFWAFTDKSWNVYNVKAPNATIISDLLTSSLKKQLLSTRSAIIVGAYRLQQFVFDDSMRDVILIAKPVLKLETGEFLGVCFAFVNENHISNIYSNNVPSNGTLMYLVSDQDVILSSPDADSVGQTYSSVAQPANLFSANKKTVGHATYMENKIALSSYGNSLYCLIPLNDLYKDIRATLFLFITIGLMGIAVALFLANKIADRITQPLSQLSKVIGNIDMGEISSRAPISGSDEITILSKSFNHLMDNQEALHEKELLSQKAVLESQFKLYQAQIIPHFLCNSLEAIISMIRLDLKEDSESMLFQLSEFYRLSLSNGMDIIPLASEISLTRDYLSIQEKRYREFFTFEIYVQCDLSPYSIPKLTLQPIVENSIYHGIKPKGSMGKISINVSDSPHYIFIKILDNGIGMSQQKINLLMSEQNTHHFALSNISSRLKLYFGPNSDFSIESKQGAYTQVVIEIPKEKNQNENSLGR